MNKEEEEEEEEGLGLKFTNSDYWGFFWLQLRLEDNGLTKLPPHFIYVFSSYSLNLKLSLHIEIFELVKYC